jgi:oligopeptide transport system substrate-binding protein
MGSTWRALAALVLGLSLGLLGGAGPAAAQDQVFRISNLVEPESLDPGVVTGVPEHRIISNLFEGLTTTDPRDLSPRPGMARSWAVSKDGLVYTFQLREAVWTDGRKVTAHDFVYAWERVLNPKSGAKYAQQLFYLRNGEEYNRGKVTDFQEVGVKAVDDRTLQVTLRCPTAYFLDLTAFYTLYPVPRWAIEAHGRDWVKPGRIVSNGAFRLASWVPQRELTLEKNPLHWDAAQTRLQKVVFIPTDDVNTAYKQFLAGDSDWIPTVPPAQIESAARRPEYYASPYLGTYYFRFNVTRAPTSDVRVRKALSMVVDREALARFVTKAGEIPTSSFVPAMRGYEGVRGLPFDPAAAQKLLAEAGYPGGRGFPRTELTYNTSELHRVITQAVQQMWKEHLGIQVELVNVEWKVYLSQVGKLDYQIARAGWIGDYPDPNTFLDMWITGGGNNQTGWSVKRYDELIARASCGTVDPRERARLLAEAERILVVDEAPIAPLFTYVNKGMLSRKVRGWHPNLLDQHPLKAISIEPRPN